jgi:hypothetical protein
METQLKRKNRKPLYILLGTMTFFVLFILLISGTTTTNKAIEEIQICNNAQEVKRVYEKYQFELIEADELGNKSISSDFQNAMRNKLASFKLNEEEIKKCIEWLPPAKTNLNLIVVPDLSKRISDEHNNPNQIAHDKIILEAVWKAFAETSYLKTNSKDKFIIDVTDPEQAKGAFSEIANELQFDLSKHKGKSNRLYFTEDKTKQFSKAITKMYQSAKEQPHGADYVFYFKRYLEKRIKKSTLHENYVNKLIIITDGYLEAQNRSSNTKLTPELYKSLIIGNTKEMISILGLNIPFASVDLTNTEVMICEVNERKTGSGKDFEILKAYWTEWLERMNAKSIHFEEREQATINTTNAVQEFIKS